MFPGSRRRADGRGIPTADADFVLDLSAYATKTRVSLVLAQQRLLARIRQDGVNGSWTAEDEQGRPCVVEHGSDGLEIYAPAEGEGDQAVNPEIVGTVPPGGNLDSLRRRIGPRPAHDQQTSTQQAGRMQAWQKYLDQLWAPRS